MTNLQFDPEVSRRVEAIYTTSDVVEQRRIAGDLLDAQRGEHVLDVGVGPGFLAAELAAAVRPPASTEVVPVSARAVWLQQAAAAAGRHDPLADHCAGP